MNPETSESASTGQTDLTSAFEKLVERHRDSVYGLAYVMTRSKACALEVSQMTFLSAYSKLDEFRSEAEFASWVRRNAARLTIRPCETSPEDQTSLRKLHQRSAPAKVVADKWNDGGGHETMTGELRQAIEDAVQKLPKDLREVLLLSDLARLTYADIAEICRKSVASIKSCLHQARLCVREAIELRSSRGLIIESL